MKTKHDIKNLNFQDYAFFKGVDATEGKWAFSDHLYTPQTIKVTKTGIPKVKVTELLPVDTFDFSMVSNSHLDGQCRLEYLCDYYNKGIDMQKLREYSIDKGCIKALRFSGVKTIVNSILNREQLLILQKKWLRSNTEYVRLWSKNTLEFIGNNKWAKEYLNSIGVTSDTINLQIER